MRAPTFGSLFAGVGGFDLGLEAAGWQCAFQVEWDKHCQSVLRHHWPTVPKWGDVQEVDGATLPPVDMITFGSPCQDLSVAGKRAGLQGGRSSMFFEATRIIKEMRNATDNVYPRTAIWENVTGALTSNNGADFGAVLDEMAHLGAVAIEWRVLDAQHFGVPQRRRRVFLVAIFDPAIAERCPDPLLPVREGRRGDFTKGRKKGQDVAGSVATSVDASSTHRKLGHGHYVEDDTASALKQRDYKDSTDLIATPVVANQVIVPLCPIDYKGVGDQYVHENKLVVQDAFVKARLAIEATEPIPIADHATRFAGSNGDREGVGKGNGFGVGEPGDPMNTLTQGDRHAVAQPVTVSQPGQMVRLGGGVSEEIVPTLRAEAKRGDNEPHIAQPITFEPETIGPLTSTGMSRARGTESVESSHVLAVNTLAVRRLTPLECERLMGWPDDHTRYTDTGKEQADTHRYKQCGNGVAAPVAEWIGRHLHPLHVHHD